MESIGILLAIAGLFYLLGKAADLVVVSVRKIGERFGIKVFFLGLIIGFLTSLPEFSIGINALIDDIADISFGNLIGGIFVLFGLVLGLSLILNRRIKTDGKLSTVLPIVAYPFIPLLMGLDGTISMLDGAVIVLLYFFIIYHAYVMGRHIENKMRITLTRKEIMRVFFSLVAGIAFIIIISHLIVTLSLSLLARFNVSTLLTGLLFFSIGTNLPEIIVTIRSWKRNVEELSLSNIFGSALANILIIGLFAFMSPISVAANGFYFVTIVCMAAALGFFAYFYETGREITQREGIALFGVYITFVIIQSAFFL